MSGSGAFRRRLANTLVRHAATVLPSGRASWAVAMREEVRQISNPDDALWWAMGCLRTGYSERFRAERLLDLRVARWGIAIWMTLQAVNGLFDGLFVLSFKLRHLGVTHFLGGQTEGDDYRRFTRLLGETSAWGCAASLLSGVLYVAVAVQILRRKRSALAFFITALSINAGLWIHDLGKPLFVQAFSPAHLQRDALLYLVTALLGVLLWLAERSTEPHQL